MNGKTMCIILFLLASTLRMYAPSDLGPNKGEIKHYRSESEDSSTFILNAQIWAESRGNAAAFCKSENAAGVLQIRPVMIRGVNRILKQQGSELRFTLNDRWSRERSIEIWKIVMAYRNPSNDVRQACLIWNGRGRDGNGNIEYYKLIKSKILEYEKAKIVLQRMDAQNNWLPILTHPHYSIQDNIQAQRHPRREDQNK